jgi:hypothetical protein
MGQVPCEHGNKVLDLLIGGELLSHLICLLPKKDCAACT